MIITLVIILCVVAFLSVSIVNIFQGDTQSNLATPTSTPLPSQRVSWKSKRNHPAKRMKARNSRTSSSFALRGVWQKPTPASFSFYPSLPKSSFLSSTNSYRSFHSSRDNDKYTINTIQFPAPTRTRVFTSTTATRDSNVQSASTTESAGGPPVAPKESKETKIHGETLVDNYYWLRNIKDPRYLPLSFTRKIFTRSLQSHQFI